MTTTKQAEAVAERIALDALGKISFDDVAWDGETGSFTDEELEYTHRLVTSFKVVRA